MNLTAWLQVELFSIHFAIRHSQYYLRNHTRCSQYWAESNCQSHISHVMARVSDLTTWVSSHTMSHCILTNGKFSMHFDSFQVILRRGKHLKPSFSPQGPQLHLLEPTILLPSYLLPPLLWKVFLDGDGSAVMETSYFMRWLTCLFGMAGTHGGGAFRTHVLLARKVHSLQF